jgi:hypothetical protein
LVSGLVATADLCAAWAERVRDGWRGVWPCSGEVVMRNAAQQGFGLVECSCPCHAGGPAHELPRLADRTAVHPTDVLADG